MIDVRRVEPRPVDRRKVLGGAALAGTVWVAPSILSFDRVAAATGSTGLILTGGVVETTAPADVDTLATTANAWVFAEQTVTLTSAQSVNAVASDVGYDSDTTAIPGGSVASGTTVCSYYLFGRTWPSTGTFQFSVDFSPCNIVGLIWRNPLVRTSNPTFGASGTTYPNGGQLDDPGGQAGGDRIVFTSATRVDVTMTLSGGRDIVRVLVGC